MSKLPQYGKVVESTQVDKDGSTIAIETNYQKGQIRYPQYKHYEYRIRVRDPKEEMTEYLRFCEEKAGMVQTNFHTETSKLGDEEGWYYAVKSWTEKI